MTGDWRTTSMGKCILAMLRCGGRTRACKRSSRVDPCRRGKIISGSLRAVWMAVGHNEEASEGAVEASGDGADGKHWGV